jgi:hypothetical protein
MSAPSSTLLLQIEPVIKQLCEESEALLTGLRGKETVDESAADKVFKAYSTLGVALEDVKSAKRAITAVASGGRRKGRGKTHRRRGPK